MKSINTAAYAVLAVLLMPVHLALGVIKALLLMLVAIVELASAMLGIFQIWLAPDDVKAEMVRLRQGGVK